MPSSVSWRASVKWPNDFCPRVHLSTIAALPIALVRTRNSNALASFRAVFTHGEPVTFRARGAPGPAARSSSPPMKTSSTIGSSVSPVVIITSPRRSSGELQLAAHSPRSPLERVTSSILHRSRLRPQTRGLSKSQLQLLSQKLQQGGCSGMCPALLKNPAVQWVCLGGT